MNFWEQMDAMVKAHEDAKRGATQKPLPMKGKLKPVRTPLTMVEMQIIDKLQNNVSFPPATAHKRFIRGLTINSELSDEGRKYLAYIAHRFRRQWQATSEEFQWIVRWKNY